MTQYIFRADPLRDPATGRKLRYDERLKKYQADADAAKAKKLAEPKAEQPEFYRLPYSQRQAIRDAESRARQQAEVLARKAQQETEAKKQAELPPWERRRVNPFTTLVREWEACHLPEREKRLAHYRALEQAEEAKITRECDMALRKHLAQSDPEIVKGREHLQQVLDGATDAERVELAKCGGYLEGGSAQGYWAAVSPLLQQRLARVRDEAAAESARQDASRAKLDALSAEETGTSALLPEQPEVPNE